MVVESELSFYQGVAAAGRCRRHALFLSRRVAPARRMVPAFRGAARWRRRASPATERGHGCLSRGAAAMIGAEGGAVDASGVRLFPCLRSEEHTSELQSLMRISYAVFCLKKKKEEPNKHYE